MYKNPMRAILFVTLIGRGHGWMWGQASNHPSDVLGVTGIAREVHSPL